MNVKSYATTLVKWEQVLQRMAYDSQIISKQEGTQGRKAAHEELVHLRLHGESDWTNN
jgi:hypothetical protein